MIRLEQFFVFASVLVGTLSVASGEPTTAVSPSEDERPDSASAGLAGRVVDREGRPLGQIVVRVLPSADEGEDEAERGGAKALVQRTGADGRFVFSDVTTGEFDVRVESDGHAFWTGKAIAPLEELSVVLERGVAVSGRVLSQRDGHAIAGARIRLDTDPVFPFGPDSGLEATADRDGAYRFDHVPAGAVHLRCVAEGHAVRTRRQQVRETAEDEIAMLEDLYLSLGGSVTGSVVDPGGQPMSGAAVSIYPLDFRHGGDPWVRPTTSDEEGRFVFDGVPSGARYVVAVSADDAAPEMTQPFRVDAGGVDGLVVKLSAGASLRIRFVAPGDTAVTAVRLRLRPLERYGTSRRAARSLDTTRDDGDGAEIDSEGWLVFRHLSPGVFSIQADADGWATVDRPEVELVAGETTDLGTLSLERGVELTGRVLASDGTPVGDASVTAEWNDMSGRHTRSSDSAPDGKFTVPGLVRIRGTVRVSAPGYGARVLDVRFGGDEDPLEITVRRAGTIRGTVKLAEDDAPGPITVRARRSAADEAVDATIEGDAFRLEGLQPATYSLEARAPGVAPTRREIHVSEGEELDVGTIVLDGGLTLRGLVVREVDGGAVPGARVRLDLGSESLGPAGDYQALTGIDGRFVVHGLEAGRFNYAVVHPDHAPLEQTLVVTEDVSTLDVASALVSGGEIRGRVTGPDGSSIAGVDVFLMRGLRRLDRRTTVTDFDGSFRFPHLAAGTYSVILIGDGRFSRSVKTVRLEKSEVRTVELGF